MPHLTNDIELTRHAAELADKAFEARTFRFSIAMLIAAICFVAAGVALSLL